MSLLKWAVIMLVIALIAALFGFGGIAEGAVDIAQFLFALFIFVVAFCSFGGLLRFIYIHATYPSQQDWSLTGMYLASLNDFYTFLLDMLLPPRPAYAALAVVAAIFIAVFGPRETRTADI